jgi:hypothetical protein
MGKEKREKRKTEEKRMWNLQHGYPHGISIIGNFASIECQSLLMYCRY